MSELKKNLRMFRPLYRGLPIIVSLMFAGTFLAKKYLRYATPMYESTAKIKLADQQAGIPNSNLYKDFDVFASSSKIGAEVELLKSKALVAKAISKLNIGTSIFRVGEMNKTDLYNKSPFIVTAEITNVKWYNKPITVVIRNKTQVELTTPDGKKIQSELNKVITTSGAVIAIIRNDKLLQKRPDLTINDQYEFMVHSKEFLLNNIIGGLDVMAVEKDVPVLRISFKNPVPQKAADVVNALSAAYITDFIDEKYKSADTTADFLNRQLKEYSGKLTASENAIENYRDANNIINIHQETETDLRKIADLKKQLASIQMNLFAIDSLNNYMNRGKDRFLELAPNFEAFTDLLSTEMIKKTKELQRDKRDLLTRFTPDNEKVKVIDDKLEDIAEYMHESIQNTGKTLRIKYNNLQQTIIESESVFIGLPHREKNMTIMERNFGLNEQIYRFLHEKRTEAEIAKAATISFHRIISEGEVPTAPVSPNSTIIKIMSAILGLFGGIAFVYGVHALKARVNDEDTISRQSLTPIAATVPLLKKGNQQTDYFRRLALQYELKGVLKNGYVITVSSYNKEEGKLFIAHALKEAFECLNKKVVLIEAEQTIRGQLELPANWKKELTQIKASYDVVIIKNFSLMDHPSAFMPMVETQLNLFLLDSRLTKRSSITHADLMKEELQLPSMHFVLNRAGYTPSLITQTRDIIEFLLKRFRK